MLYPPPSATTWEEDRMPITQLLERNAREYGDEVALVEINPDIQEVRRVT